MDTSITRVCKTLVMREVRLGPFQREKTVSVIGGGNDEKQQQQKEHVDHRGYIGGGAFTGQTLG